MTERQTGRATPYYTPEEWRMLHVHRDREAARGAAILQAQERGVDYVEYDLGYAIEYVPATRETVYERHQRKWRLAAEDKKPETPDDHADIVTNILLHPKKDMKISGKVFDRLADAVEKIRQNQGLGRAIRK